MSSDPNYQGGDEQRRRFLGQALLDSVNDEERLGRTPDQPVHQARDHQGWRDTHEVNQPRPRLLLRRGGAAPRGEQNRQAEEKGPEGEVEDGPVVGPQCQERDGTQGKTTAHEDPIEPDQPTARAILSELVDPDIARDEDQLGAEADREANREPGPDVLEDRQQHDAQRHEGGARCHRPGGAQATDQRRSNPHDGKHGDHLRRRTQAVQPG
jgi:hypothetical protein